MAGDEVNMGIDALTTFAQRSGRVEFSNSEIFDQFELKLADSTVQQIRQLEESIMTAEERLGNFRVGQ